MEIKHLLLEKALDVELLTRTPTGVRPTYAGQRLFGYARGVISLVNDATAVLSEARARMFRAVVGMFAWLTYQCIKAGYTGFTGWMEWEFTSWTHINVRVRFGCWG